MNIVIINLDGQKNLPNNEEENPTLVGLLNTIFTSPLDSAGKIQRLEDVYSIPRTEKIKEGVAKMCNLSSGILEKGRAEGKIEGKELEKANGISILIATLRELKQTDMQIIEQLVSKYNLSLDDASYYLQQH